MNNIEYENLGELNKSFFDAYKQAFERTLTSGWYILGNNVTNFENQYADYVGSKNCIGLASGLDALSLALRCYEFPVNSEVIVPSNTYIATILSILQNGLKPILVEPDINTYNINPSIIEEKIPSKTRAIMVVHLYGKCCKMDTILEISKKYNLKVIEDCAEAIGSKYKDTFVGNFGDIATFSFYGNKTITTGEGGMVVTKDKKLFNKIVKLKTQGLSVKKKNEYYNHDIIGYNYRMTNICASIGYAQLKKIKQFINRKNKINGLYKEYLRDVDVKFQESLKFSRSTYWLVNIILKSNTLRNKVEKYLLKKKIEKRLILNL